MKNYDLGVYMFKRLMLVLACLAALSAFPAKVRPLNFQNPGNRRLLKTEQGNYWYYRSLPEKSMILNVEGVSTLELRAFGLQELRKPQVITIISRQKKTWDLSLQQRLDGFHLYRELSIPIPAGTQTIEILCYERGIYFRPFHTVGTEPKPKTAKPANLAIGAHGGVITVSHNGTDSPYYVFNTAQGLKFTVNNGREAIVFVRARLLDRSLPVFALYRDGDLLGTHEFTLRRSTKYKAAGVDHLTIGLKLELPPNSGSAQYELRALSDHLFFARPLLLKTGRGQ